MKTAATNLTRAARRFHALSDETRLRVVEMLSSGERCVCELQDAVGAAQSRLSFHLKVLREAGVVSARREGRWMYYALRPDALEEMAGYLHERKPEATWGAPASGARSASSCCE